MRCSPFVGVTRLQTAMSSQARRRVLPEPTGPPPTPVILWGPARLRPRVNGHLYAVQERQGGGSLTLALSERSEGHVHGWRDRPPQGGPPEAGGCVREA